MAAIVVSVGFDDKTLFVHEKSGELLFSKVLQSHLNGVDVSSNRILVTGHGANALYLFDDEGEQTQMILTTDKPSKAVFHSSGEKFAVGFDTGLFRIYHFDGEWAVLCEWQDGELYSPQLCWIQDSVCVGSPGGALVLFDGNTGAVEKLLQRPVDGQGVSTIATPQGQPGVVFYVFGQGKLRRREVQKPHHTEFQALESFIWGLAPSPSEDLLYSCFEESIRCWDVQNQRVIWSISMAHPVQAIALNGDELIAGVYNSDTVAIQADTGDVLRTYGRHSFRVFSVAARTDFLKFSE